MVITYSDFALRFLSGPVADENLQNAQPSYVDMLIEEAKSTLSESFYGSHYKKAVLLHVADQIVSAASAAQNGGYSPNGAVSSVQVTDSGYSIQYGRGGNAASGGQSGVKSAYAHQLSELRRSLATPTNFIF